MHIGQYRESSLNFSWERPQIILIKVGLAIDGVGRCSVGLQQQIMSTTTETPFEQLQKRDKQRRVLLKKSIHNQDLKHRAITYNFKKATPDLHEQTENKSNEKVHTRMTFNNSIKKSFFYRKLLNHTIDCHLTSEDFQKVKHKFDQVNDEERQNFNKSILFREIWEQQHQRTNFNSLYDDNNNNLEVISKNNEANRIKIATVETSTNKKELTQANIKIEDISLISQERKANLTFNLEIMGNKKNLRIKDTLNSKKNRTKINKTSEQLEKQQTQQSRQDSKPPVTKQKTNGSDSINNKCSFLKRFQQENSALPKEDTNPFFKISKIGHNILDLYRDALVSQEPSSKFTRRPQANDYPYTSQQKRQIKSSWSYETPLSETGRYSRRQTQKKLQLAPKIKKPAAVHFTNDIKGWMVGQDPDEFAIDSTFQK